MAAIGLRYSAFARIKSHTEGSAITYEAGREIGMNISANIAITRNSNKLYANDVTAEEDNSISSAQITINQDDLTLANEQYLLGLASSGADTAVSYEDTDDAAPLGGYGYVRVCSKTDQTTGVTTKSYIATWWYKVRARIDAEETKTKGANVEWQTPSIIFSASGVYIDATDKMKFRKRQEFGTYAEAKAFIDNFANIADASASAASVTAE